MRWESIGALDLIRRRLKEGQLEPFTPQTWAASRPRLEIESAVSVEAIATASVVMLRCGPTWLASLDDISQVLRHAPRVHTVEVVVGSSCEIPVDEIVASIARETNRRLRNFWIRTQVYEDVLRISDEGIKQLVAFCPLLESLTVHTAVGVTEASMLMMHARWRHTLRYLDISGMMDRKWENLGDRWFANNLWHGYWFFYDAGFAD